MLGKLIKYDLSGLAKILLPLHGGVVLLSVLERLLLTAGSADLPVPALVTGGFTLVYIIYLTGAYAATFILIVYHFYKDLYSDYGYLSFTLPVKPASHLLSKSITALLCTWFSTLVIGACVLLVLLNERLALYRTLAEIGEAFLSLMRTDEDFHRFVYGQLVAAFFLSVLSILLMYVRFYMCFTIGQLANRHRVALAVALWFGLRFIRQVITFIFQIGFLSSDSWRQLLADLFYFNSADEFREGVYILEIFGAIPGVLFLVLYWVICVTLMKKRLNLA